jgi:quinol monooxygenase YgiN
MTVRNSSRPIARVFRATAAPGCRDELLQRFHSSSAALVNSKVGCLKYRILEPVDALAPEVVFESIWRDLDAVKVAFGDAWQQSHLPEGYSILMTACSVHHFDANLSRPYVLLRAYDQWPARHHTTKKRDELAPFHCKPNALSAGTYVTHT